jgi:hypothetical protein
MPSARGRFTLLGRLPRNVWAAGLASCCMDISSEMVLNLLPLFLANALGGRPPSSA